MADFPDEQQGFSPQNTEYLRQQVSSLIEFDLKNFGEVAEETEQFAKTVFSDAEYSALVIRFSRGQRLGSIPKFRMSDPKNQPSTSSAHTTPRTFEKSKK